MIKQLLAPPALKRGFTLVELLVVIAIIGVLMGGVVAVLNPARFFSDSRNARRKSDLGVVQAALEMYYSQNGSYPDSGSVPFGSSWTAGSTTYLRQVPRDPQSTNQPYCYNKIGNNYLLCAEMEGAGYSCPFASCACDPSDGSYDYNYCLENPY